MVLCLRGQRFIAVGLCIELLTCMTGVTQSRIGYQDGLFWNPAQEDFKDSDEQRWRMCVCRF